jgi:hypothetical protein
VRQAVVLACDDLLVSLNGKLAISGLYTGDILIPSQPFLLAQLIFLFVIEGTVDDLPKLLTLEIQLPGQPSIQNRIDLPPGGIQPESERARWTLKMPLRIAPALLSEGRIEAKVIHENGEISARAPWIVKVA